MLHVAVNTYNAGVCHVKYHILHTYILANMFGQESSQSLRVQANIFALSSLAEFKANILF